MSASTYPGRSAGDDRPGIAQWLTLITGIVFVVIGVAGFIVTGFDRFADHSTGETLVGFEVNPLHNLVHLAIGIPALFLWRTLRGAGLYGAFVAVVYGAATVYGLLAIGTDADILSLNDADNWLHLALTVLGFVIAVIAYVEARNLGDRAGTTAGTDRFRGRGGTASPGRA